MPRVRENPDTLDILTIPELLQIARSAVRVPSRVKHNKGVLIRYLRGQGQEWLVRRLESAAAEKAAEVARRREDGQQRRVETQRGERAARRAAAREWQPPDPMHYLRLPSKQQVEACYREFYAATSNAGVALGTCGVCGRERHVRTEGLTRKLLAEVPHAERLVPSQPHPAHTLVDGKLLEPAGVQQQADGSIFVNVCNDCLRALDEDGDVPPPLALANNMWIGQIPPELASLTIPEQLLVALLFPRVYVFKLWPRSGYRPGVETLQRALRGTVSTYEVDIEGVADMIAGNMMPRPPAILASVIAVTFVGFGRLPLEWLKHTFRVRRQHVANALRWLRANNRHYAHLTISAERLASLPEDDVPMEIAECIRQEIDAGVVEEEGAGYVPEHEDEVVADAMEVDEDDPEVAPLHVTGSVDCDLSNMTAHETMLWGMSNLWQEGGEGGYSVRHGRLPVRDFAGGDGGTLFERTFPCLFPYGVGGIESDRPVRVDFLTHVQWALCYFDRRFRKHEHFPFYCFGIHQRHQALASARVQMRREQFDRDAQIMSSVTVEQLKRACDDEAHGRPITDPGVRVLMRHVQATAGRVVGCDQSRLAVRSQIWSTAALHGPPSLWITINPSDIHDPVAQVFAGEAINLDDFVRTSGPDAERRARNIAADPFAASRFFHFMIKTVFETLFQIQVTRECVKTNMGVLGEVVAYIGTVESQGRGTLHLHTLLWLKDTPSADDMVQRLKQEEFRSQIKAYIAANLRAYVPGLECEDSVKAIPVEKDIAYNRPPAPGGEDYEDRLRGFELRLARTEQVHTCKLRRCLVDDGHGNVRCRRRAPFDRAPDDFVTETGEWGPKRLYGYMNGWVPAVLVNARCNNDGKLLTCGEDTRNLAFYVTMYSAKKQGRNFNLSAVFAKALAYHEARREGSYREELRHQQSSLLFQLVNAINREQELAAVMVIAYLMGWGDVIRSHMYTPLYWRAFEGALLRTFPALRQVSSLGRSLQDGGDRDPREAAESQGEQHAQDDEELDQERYQRVMLDLDSGGRLYARSQVTDYSLRGDALHNCSLLDFVTNTYERTVGGRRGQQRSDEEGGSGARSGRPPNQRVPYLPQHPNAGGRERVVRSRGHRNLPNIVGGWLPRRDDPGVREFYCASVLMLLKPWRNMARDLKRPSQTWSDALDEFLATAPRKVGFVLSGLQYYHECRLAADRDRATASSRSGAERRSAQDVEEEMDDELWTEDMLYPEEGLQQVRASRLTEQEDAHAKAAIMWAMRANIFSAGGGGWDVAGERPAVGATGGELAALQAWRAQMREDVRRRNEAMAAPTVEDTGEENTAAVTQLSMLSAGPAVLPELDTAQEAALPPLPVDDLRDDQFRAYDIIAWHLEETLAGRDPDPLRMIIYGEGGTGKSKVIQTVTQEFARRDMEHLLVKTAYTGTAASLIDGKTMHVVGQLSVTDLERLTDESKALLQEFWRGRKYLIIDEYSMVSKSFLAALSRHVSIGKVGCDDYKPCSFGGVNVVLCGDLHQFPPVACRTRDILYKPSAPGDKQEERVGRGTYEEFRKVVILKEQMRVTDPVWKDFLDHLRYGRVEDRHIEMLRTLIITAPESSTMDFRRAPWSSASLVTPRHAVRKEWNEHASKKWCRERGARLYVVRAEDRIRGRPLSGQERYALGRRTGGRKALKGKELPDELRLAKGMQVMVTTNVQTDLDITNGARGEIVDIVLDPEEAGVLIKD